MEIKAPRKGKIGPHMVNFFGFPERPNLGISHEEVFENMLRLVCFGVYFKNKMAIFIKK